MGNGGRKYREDQVHASGDYGGLFFAIRKDDHTALAGADGDYIPLIVDSDGRLYTNGIDWVHSRTHMKKAFVVHFENEVTNINEQTVIAFNAPATDEVHLVVTAESTHEANVFIYRDTSIDAGDGTQIAVVNRNQVAPLGTSGVFSIESTPVVNKMTSFNETQASGANITTTTELEQVHLLGGEGPKAVGARATGRNEWIFSGSTQVAIVMNAETNDTATHIISLDWYEE